MEVSFWKDVQEPSRGIHFSLSGKPAIVQAMPISMLFWRRFCDKVSLISSNKGGVTNFPVEYGGIFSWLVFCSSAYSEEKLSRYNCLLLRKLLLLFKRIQKKLKLSSFITVLNSYSQRNNWKPVLIAVIA